MEVNQPGLLVLEASSGELEIIVGVKKASSSFPVGLFSLSLSLNPQCVGYLPSRDYALYLYDCLYIRLWRHYAFSRCPLRRIEIVRAPIRNPMPPRRRQQQQQQPTTEH